MKRRTLPFPAVVERNLLNIHRGFANVLFYQNKPLIRRGFAMRQPRSVSNGLGEVGESTGLLL